MGQLTLGELVIALESMSDKHVTFDGIHHPSGRCSWRGNYTDLAIEYGNEEMGLALFLDICKSTIGMTFCGYRGGEYLMNEDTLVWVANYGEYSGFKGSKPLALVGVVSGVTLETK